MIAVPLDRGLSDTNGGEVNPDHYTKKHRIWRFVVTVPSAKSPKCTQYVGEESTKAGEFLLQDSI